MCDDLTRLQEIYKIKYESFAVRSCEETRVRECVKAMLSKQANAANAMHPHQRASTMNAGLLEDCARRAIQFGAPAYNRRDFDV